MADIGDGAVAVVRQCLTNDGDTGRTIALVSICFVVDIAGVAAVEHALDVVVGDVVCLCLGNAVAQLGVVIRVGRAALFDCDCHFTADFRENRGLFCIIGALSLGDIIPFRMSRHLGVPPLLLSYHG